MSEWNDNIIKEFRTNNGVVGGPFTGMPLLLVTTTGAKSGEKRISPVAWFPDGDNRIIVASKGGAPTHPHWFHNLVKHPQVHVEAGTANGIEEYDAVASIMPEPERTERYKLIGDERPGFAEYQTKTDRKIPLVVLTPVK